MTHNVDSQCSDAAIVIQAIRTTWTCTKRMQNSLSTVVEPRISQLQTEQILPVDPPTH
jgi:hypothetical protein